MDPVMLLIAAAVGLIVLAGGTAAVLHFRPTSKVATQIEQLASGLHIHLHGVASAPAVVTAAPPGAAVAPAPATPSPATAAPPAAATPTLAPAPAVRAAPADPSPGNAAPVVLPLADRFPKLITIAGVHVAAAAPINPAWKPSTNAWLFGHLDGTFVNDPGMPPGARSPAGYPLFNGAVSYGDSTYPDDAALARVLLAEAAQNPRAYDATVDVPGQGFPVMTPDDVTATLAPWDACMAAGREDWAFYGLKTPEHFALQNRGVYDSAFRIDLMRALTPTRNNINSQVNKYNGQAAPADFNSSPRFGG